MPTTRRSFLAASLALATPSLPLSLVSSLHADQQLTEAKRDDKTVIVQMADPQFFVPQIKRATTIPAETLADEALRCAERLDPDCVVVTGDLVHHPGNQDEIDTYWKHFKTLDPKITLHNVPGNHDINHTPESIEKYKKQFGKDYYAFSIGPDRFLVLNSVLLRTKMDAEGAARQWKWLEGQLEKAKADKVRHLVVFQHHPLFLFTPNEPDSLSSIKKIGKKSPLKKLDKRHFRKENRTRLYRLFEKYGVKAVFSGHLHVNTINTYNGVEYVSTNSLCSPALYTDPAGFRVIELGPNGVTHRYITHQEYPNVKEKRKTSACIPAAIAQ